MGAVSAEEGTLPMYEQIKQMNLTDDPTRGKKKQKADIQVDPVIRV